MRGLEFKEASFRASQGVECRGVSMESLSERVVDHTGPTILAWSRELITPLQTATPTAKHFGHYSLCLHHI